MSKKVKILLVEDDKKFAESLSQILTKEGYEVVHAEKPQTALSYCKLQPFDAAIVDCMLPQMNGIDLSVKLKQITGNGISLYLMSGIYKDRNFSVAALKKTSAKSFLIKPFDIAALLEQLKETFGEKSEIAAIAAEPGIRGLFFQENFGTSQVIQAIEDTPAITCAEIPFAINALLTQKASGALNLNFEDKSFMLHFHDGRLYLDSPAINNTQLRGYLSKKDYVIQEDIRILPEKSFSLRLLQEASHLSPHNSLQIEKEFAIQNLVALRQNQNLQVTFKQEPLPERPLLELSLAETDDLIYEWIMATPLIWFKAFYVKYMSNSIRKMSVHQTKTTLFPIVSANKHIVSIFLNGKSISEILTEAKADDNTFFKLMHLLLVYREFFIGERKQVTNHVAQIERLKSLLSTIEHQDAYERLGLTSLSSDADIKKSYTELSQNLHPDKLLDAPEELVTLSKEVYSKIQDAYNQIKSSDKREQYKRYQDNLRKEKHVNSLRLLEQAQNQLMRGDLQSAEPLLQEAENNAPHSPRLKLLQVWLGIKTKKQQPQQATRILQTLPQEEKDSAVYHFVRGLVSFASGEMDKAQMHYNNALNKDNDFMPARRELLLIPKNDKKQVNIFSSDIKDVVGLFFKKK